MKLSFLNKMQGIISLTGVRNHAQARRSGSDSSNSE